MCGLWYVWCPCARSPVAPVDTLPVVATGDALQRWDKVLHDVERTLDTPSMRQTRKALETGAPATRAPRLFQIVTGAIKAPFTDLWQVEKPTDPKLLAVLQPVADAAGSFDRKSPLLPQVDQYSEVVATARQGLDPENISAPTVEEIITDMYLTLKISLLVAGTSHLGSIRVIDEELAERNSAIAKGLARPVRYYDFATQKVIDAPSDTALSLAAFAAIVDPGPASTWEEGLKPDPADQPPVMKLFAAQVIVNYYTEWEEYYRRELAQAHECSVYDFQINYFGDLGRMRHDYVHRRGFCGNSDSEYCEMLKWFSKGDIMIPTPTNYLQLLTEFPADELRRKPVAVTTGRDQIKGSASIPILREFDDVAGTERKKRGAALDEALSEWTAKNRPAE